MFFTFTYPARASSILLFSHRFQSPPSVSAFWISILVGLRKQTYEDSFKPGLPPQAFITVSSLYYSIVWAQILFHSSSSFFFFFFLLFSLFPSDCRFIYKLQAQFKGLIFIFIFIFLSQKAKTILVAMSNYFLHSFLHLPPSNIPSHVTYPQRSS